MNDLAGFTSLAGKTGELDPLPHRTIQRPLLYFRVYRLQP